MPNPIHTIKSSFSGGEFAPSLYARIDIQKWVTGAKKLLNFFVHPHGGISNRSGTYKVAASKKDESKVRVKDFQFASDENYVIEFGDYYCRFYADDLPLEKTAGTTWATTSTYVVSDIINTANIIYRCLIAHTSGTFSTDLAASKWEIDVNKWVTSTLYSLGDFLYYNNSTITYCLQDHTSSTSFAADLTAGKVTAQTIYEVPMPYSEDDLDELRFAQSADVLFIVHPDYASRELARYNNTVWELTEYEFLNGPFMLPNDDTTFTMRTLATTGSTTLVSSAAFFFPTHVGGQMQVIHEIEGQAMAQAITGATLSTSITCGGTWRVISHGTWTGKFLIQKSTDSTNWTVLRQFSGANDFNVDTYGSEDMSNGALPFLIRVNAQNGTASTFTGTLNIDLTTDPYTTKGVAEMVTYISPTQMAVSMQRATGSTVAVSNWAEGAWSDYRGWPQTVTFTQDRLVFAGNYYNPQTIWMTQTGNYYNFFVNNPIVDSDSISINLPSQKLNEINGLVSLLKLLVFSSGAEWTVGSEQGSILAPSSISVTNNSQTGSSGIGPLVILNRAIYVQSRGAVIRDLGYDIFTTTFTGNNLSIIANHLFFNHNIVDWCYQQDPDSLVWAVRDDGKLLCMTYMREQEVLAWTQCDTNDGDDLFESVCSIPAEGYNQVWFVVNRDGQRYIERMAKRMDTELRKDQYFVDCGVSQDSSTTPDTNTELLMHFDVSPFTDDVGNTVDNISPLPSTVLLLHCDGTNQGVTFTDSETVPKTVDNDENYDSYSKLCSHFDGDDGATAYTDPIAGAATFGGTAQLDTAQYKFGTASLLLDGDSDYITYPDSDSWNFGSGSFTIDFWVRFAVLPATGYTAYLYSQYVDDDNRVYLYLYNDTGTYSWRFRVTDGGSLTISLAPSTTVAVNTWYHVAVVRSGNSFMIFQDGVQLGTTVTDTSSIPDLAGDLYIGQRGSDAGYLNGWVDEYRVSQGVARWTSVFTVPAHAYGKVATVTGVKKFGTASANFLGDGSYLSLADSDDWNFGAGDFTIDMWLYINSISSVPGIIQQKVDANNFWNLYLSSDRYLRFNVYNSSSQVAYHNNYTTQLATETWYHIALVRSGSVYYIFLNGTLLSCPETLVGTIPDLAGLLIIGVEAYSGGLFNGYIDELRVSKGIARWVSNFSPSTIAYGSSVSSDTAIKIFGGGSAYFIPETYLTVDDSADWDFGTDDFTIETWVRFYSVSTRQSIIDINDYQTTGIEIDWNTDNNLYVYMLGTGHAFSWTPQTLRWYHIAVTRSGTSLRVFIDGVQIGNTLTSNEDITGGTDGIRIGNSFNDLNWWFTGWLDEMRISNGIARWTSNFTPPTSAYTLYDLPFTTVSGLDHLEGQTVSILADGNVITAQEVTGSTITLPNPASLCHAGLGYNCDLETLNIEVGLSDGTLQGRKVHVSRVIMRLDKARGGYLGPDFDHLYEILGDYKTSVATSLYTGDVKLVLGGGYSDGGRFCYRQSDPLPVTVLGLIPILTTGETTGL